MRQSPDCAPFDKLGGVKRRMGRDGELKSTSAVGTLIEPWACAIGAVQAARQDRGALKSTGRTCAATRPDHRLKKLAAAHLIGKCGDHIFDGLNLCEKRPGPVRHDHASKIQRSRIS